MLKLIIVTFFFLTTTLSLCAQAEKSLVGKWKFQDIYNKEVIDMRNVSEIEKASFRNMYIQLDASGDQESFVLNQQIKGKWLLTENKKNLVLKTRNSSVILEILKLNGQEMVVKVGNGEFVLRNEYVHL